MNKFLLIGAALVCTPGLAAAQQSREGAMADAFTGPRIEARIGWETPTVSGDGEVYKIGSAVSFGGEIGFDLRAGNSAVVGLYTAYELSGVSLCDGLDCLEVDGNLGAGVRAGFTASPTTLIYGKLGYANMKISATSGTFSASENAGGIQGALGVEMNFTPMVYGKLEASYADYGQFFGINLQRRHVAAGVGVRF